MSKHAKLSPSGAHRWMQCPGSVGLSERIVGKGGGGSSPYAAEGTLAHELGERCLRDGTDPSDHVGGEITDEMAEAVRHYVDHVRGLKPRTLLLEERVNLDRLGTPVPMFGTVDAALQAEDGHLHIVDYKHGAGVFVSPERNPQLMYYALGFVLSRMSIWPDAMTLTVVQPRCGDEPVRSWVMRRNDLEDFKDELLKAARRAMQPDAPVGPVGDHCRFCPALATCPAQSDNAVMVAQKEFREADNLPAPFELSEDHLRLVLDQAPAVIRWLKAVQDHAHERLEAGEEVPGWKLVAKRGYRRWDNERKAVEFLTEQGVPLDKARPRKLVSPAQAEKLVKGKLPEGLVTKTSSGTNMVREANPKPAVKRIAVRRAQSEFTVKQ